ncbi:MAG: InlB B-repeat-containing protein [Methanobrevibacter sp.]|nr:InlB B-repeat-containing protein [Methanobrevibacter sp.]
MNKRKIIILLILFATVFCLATGVVSATNTVIKDKSDDKNVKIESKAKTVKYKITWKANGGKIGTKKIKVTYVKKGSKIKKLVANPKRSGYYFYGWYTKKSGGKLISKNTKPKKSVTYYAHWVWINSGKNYVQFAPPTQKVIPNLNVNLFKKAPSFNINPSQIVINTEDNPSHITNAVIGPSDFP